MVRAHLVLIAYRLDPCYNTQGLLSPLDFLPRPPKARALWAPPQQLILTPLYSFQPPSQHCSPNSPQGNSPCLLHL